MGHMGYGKARVRSKKLKGNKYPNTTKSTLCTKKEEFIDKSCAGTYFCQLYLTLEETLVRAILKLQVAKACLLTLKGRGTAQLSLIWLNSFLPSCPFPSPIEAAMFEPSLPCSSCRLHPVIRCWLAQDTAQRATRRWLSSPDCLVAVLEILPWPCVRLPGHCGKKTQNAALSLRSRTFQVKFKGFFPELPLKVNQHCSVQKAAPQKTRAGPEICLLRMTKCHWNIRSQGTWKASLISSEAGRSIQIVAPFEKRRGASYRAIFHFSIHPFLS